MRKLTSMEPNRRKTDLSPNQLKLVRVCARKEIRGYRNRAILGFLVLLLAVVYLWNSQERSSIERAKEAQDQRAQIVRSGNIVAIDGCNRDFLDRQALRGLLTASQAASKRSYRRDLITKTRYELSREFFQEQLKALPLPDCRNASNTLTTNPNKPLNLPAPLYPKPQSER